MTIYQYHPNKPEPLIPSIIRWSTSQYTVSDDIIEEMVALFILNAKRNCGYLRVVAVRDLCLRATGLSMLKKGSVGGSIITLGIVAAAFAARARATQNDMDNFKYNKRLNRR